eukprot:755363-Pleurochrysis_carterae.AAC.2
MIDENAEENRGFIDVTFSAYSGSREHQLVSQFRIEVLNRRYPRTTQKSNQVLSQKPLLIDSRSKASRSVPPCRCLWRRQRRLPEPPALATQTLASNGGREGPSNDMHLAPTATANFAETDSGGMRIQRLNMEAHLHVPTAPLKACTPEPALLLRTVMVNCPLLFLSGPAADLVNRPTAAGCDPLASCHPVYNRTTMP